MTATISTRMGPTEWGILAVLSVLWGGSFFFLEIMLRELPPFTAVLARLGFAAILLTAYMVVRRQALPKGVLAWAALTLLAALNNVVPFVMYAYAQQQISSGLASILNATTPLWGVIVAHIFTRDERATPAKIVGVAFGIAGVATMVGDDALSGLGSNVFGQLACVTATLAYALAGVYARRFQAMGIGPVAVSAGQLIAGTVLILPLAAVFEAPWTLPMPHAATWAATAGMVVLSTVIAYILYFRLIERAGATNSLLVTFTIPIVAILLGVGVLGEELAAKHILGMVLIALGLVAIDGRPLARLRRRRELAPEPTVP